MITTDFTEEDLPIEGGPRQIQADRARRRPLADHNINGKILHRRIQHFLHLTVQAMNLVHMLDVRIDTAGAAEIASRSRGTPRLANRFLKRVRDYAHSRPSRSQ